jgi:colanic acid/amylovoran biosynthesis glycosyltransferase
MIGLDWRGVVSLQKPRHAQCFDLPVGNAAAYPDFCAGAGESSRTLYASFVGLAAAAPSIDFGADKPCLLTADRSRNSRVLKAAYRVTGYDPEFHRRVRALDASLIHAHFAEDGPMALPLAVDLGLPMIVTLHGSVEPIADKYLLRSLRNAMYVMRRKDTWRRTAKFLCVSEFIRDVAIRAGYPEEKLVVHYTGIDLTRFRSAGTEGRDRNLVLFVGRLDEKKGCRYLIAAMALVRRVHPGARLLVIGNGSQRASLESQARELAIACSFAGALPPAAVSDHLRKAWVFCGPSVRARDGNCEGLGMVFAEAQASGLPVVSFAHGGIPEVVRHGETGLLAPEGDVEVLAAYIGEILGKKYPWNAVSARGVEWVKKQFDLAKQTRILEEIYDEIVGDEVVGDRVPVDEVEEVYSTSV